MQSTEVQSAASSSPKPQKSAFANIDEFLSAKNIIYHHHHNCFMALFFWDHLGEPVPEENFWTLWCKGRLTEADTLTIRLGATPSGLTSAHLHRPPYFLRAGCPSCRPTNSVKALKAAIWASYL